MTGSSSDDESKVHLTTGYQDRINALNHFVRYEQMESEEELDYIYMKDLN